MSAMKIGLCYDLRADYLALGWSPEDVLEFDTEETIDLLEEAVRESGHDAVRIGHAKALAARLVAGDRWDLVFNIAEGAGGRGREAQVPALLELYGVGYTFADPLACAATLDKAVAKRIVRDHGLPTPGFHVVRRRADLDGLDRLALRYPLFAKPVAEGTGKGVWDTSRAETPAQLRQVCAQLLERFRQPVLVEEFLPGREFTVAVLGNGDGARALGTLEVVFTAGHERTAYTGENKANYEGRVDYRFPEPGPLRDKVERLAVDAYRALECRDCARADLRLDRDGEPSFLEINPLPGLNRHHSDLPLIAREAAGLEYRDLIGAIIRHACDRLGIRHDA